MHKSYLHGIKDVRDGVVKIHPDNLLPASTRTYLYLLFTLSLFTCQVATYGRFAYSRHRTAKDHMSPVSYPGLRYPPRTRNTVRQLAQHQLRGPKGTKSIVCVEALKLVEKSPGKPRGIVIALVSAAALLIRYTRAFQARH